MRQAWFVAPVARTGDRRRVAHPAEVRTLQPGRAGPRARMKSVTIVDVSVSGAALRMPVDTEIVLHDVFELGIDDSWSTVRVVWARRDADDVLVCGVEFLDATPAVLPALHRVVQPEAEFPSAVNG